MNFIDQKALTVIQEIDSRHMESLTRTLATIQADVESNSDLPFSKLQNVHFCRFVIVPGFENSKGNKIPAQLAYSTNFDISLDNHITHICAPDVIQGFVKIFSCCKGFDSSLPAKEALESFIRKYQRKVNTFYRGHRGLSVDLIRRERDIYKNIQEFLNRNLMDGLTKRQIKNNISIYVKSVTAWNAVLEVKLSHLSLAALGVMFAGVVILGIVIACFFGVFLETAIPVVIVLLSVVSYLRFLEVNADQLSETDENYVSVQDLTRQEDILIQNQLTHLVELRAGRFRRVLQRFGLWAIDLLATYTYNKGRLGDIVTIHFARWSMIDDGGRLMFFSNFDGSWENYLGDFVDRAAVGLTLAWSNTREFPKTKFLALGGATDEGRFKAWTRKYQIPTQVWYSAYKDLTVKNVLNNHQIALGIDRVMTDRQIDEWLKRL